MVIYVPQGHSAILTKASAVFDIDCLYTDDFSTCNIMVCIGTDAMVLMHMDYNVPPNTLREEIELIENITDITIMHKSAGKNLSQQIKSEVFKNSHAYKITIQELEDTCSGVSVSFTGQIKIHNPEKKPKNILHHPQEQKFLTVQKIEQLIGARAVTQTKKTRAKKICIFDTLNWEAMESWHFSVDTNHSSTQKEMAMFSPNDTYVTIAEKLNTLLEAIQENNLVPILIDAKQLSISIAPYIEDYFNNYDHEKIFKQDLSEILLNQQKFPGYEAASKEDKELKSNALSLLENDKTVFKKVSELVSKYQETTPKTEFKENFLTEFSLLDFYYQKRQYYKDLYNKYNEQKIQAQASATETAKRYNNKEYEAAKNLFFEIAQKITYCCDKSDPLLAASYHNLGRSYFFCNELELSQFFLKKSLVYKEKYVDPKPPSSEIQKTKNALKDCEQKLKERLENSNEATSEFTK